MNYFSVIFYSHSRGPLDDVRTIYKDHLRKLNLRYSSDIYFPESGWSTPAFGVPLELNFLVKIPKDRLTEDKALLKSLVSLSDNIKKDVPGIIEVSIKTNCQSFR